MASTISTMVDGHEDLVSFGILHLKDQHAEGCTIVGDAEEGCQA